MRDTREKTNDESRILFWGREGGGQGVGICPALGRERKECVAFRYIYGTKYFPNAGTTLERLCRVTVACGFSRVFPLHYTYFDNFIFVMSILHLFCTRLTGFINVDTRYTLLCCM